MLSRNPRPQTQQTPADESKARVWERLRPRTTLLALGLVLLTLLVFVRAVRCGFVDYDDGDYVTNNARVQEGLTWAGVKWAFTTGRASNWHPLTWLSHMMDVQLYGLAPAGHHLTSVALHGVNAGLVFALLATLTGATWRSLIVAGFFALHPLRVESVAWVSERKDGLSFCFGLLAIGAYARYARKLRGRNAKSETALTRVWPPYVLALLCFALSLMSKPMFVTLPGVLLLLDYWPLRRMEQKPGIGLGGVTHRLLPGLLLEKLPFFALAAASSVVTFMVQRKGGAVASVAGLPLGLRLENAVVSYVRYLLKTVWPTDLATLYPHPGHWPIGWIIVATLLVASITAVVFVRRGAWPFALVGWLWFVGTLVPVIGLVQVGIQSMADRYTYLPSVGLLVAVVWLVHDAAMRFRLKPAVIVLPVAGFAMVIASLAWRQIGFWRNTETLFSRAVAVTRDNYLAYNNLGYYFANYGRVADAITNYQQSVRIKPDYADALNNLGHAFAKLGRDAEALPWFEAALRARPNHVEVHNNLGNSLANLGRVDEAIAHYEIALREQPDHADAHNNYGVALAMKGRLEQAVRHFHEAIRLRPNHAGSHSNLGNALAVGRQWDGAMREYRVALRLQPDDAQAHNNLGNVLAEKGRLQEATQHYQRALALNAANPEASFNLGMVLLRLGQRDDAARRFREALRLKPGYAEAQRQLEGLGGGK